MEVVMSEAVRVVFDSSNDKTRNLCLRKVHRSTPRAVQQPVESYERLTGGSAVRELPPRRQTAFQTPRQKDRPTNYVNVRQPANTITPHATEVRSRSGNSLHYGPGRLTIGRRLPTCPTKKQGHH
jgi:hypothetical protein